MTTTRREGEALQRIDEGERGQLHSPPCGEDVAARGDRGGHFDPRAKPPSACWRRHLPRKGESQGSVTAISRARTSRRTVSLNGYRPVDGVQRFLSAWSGAGGEYGWWRRWWTRFSEQICNCRPLSDDLESSHVVISTAAPIRKRAFASRPSVALRDPCERPLACAGGRDRREASDPCRIGLRKPDAHFRLPVMPEGQAVAPLRHDRADGCLGLRSRASGTHTAVRHRHPHAIIRAHAGP